MLQPLTYPRELPGPSEAPIQSAERRLMSEHHEARPAQRDRLAQQDMVFPAFNATQEAAFWTWYRTTLSYGAAWFSASWPMPQGGVGTRRFISAPKYAFIAGGYWRITASFEVRGTGEAPLESECALALTATELAQAQTFYLYDTYGPGTTNEAIEGIYHSIKDVGGVPSGADPWPIEFVVDWDDLPPPPMVTVFTYNRTGSPSQIAAGKITVNGAPRRWRSCRAAAFLAAGHSMTAEGPTTAGWGSVALALPGDSDDGALTIRPGYVIEGGIQQGHLAAEFLLVNEGGRVRGEFI